MGASMKSAASVKWIITKIGRDLPDRERIPATKTTRVKMEPAGALWTTHGIDTYKVVGEVDKSKNNLEGKKLVLLFGKESHPLTRLFMVPKLSVIYQNITLSDKDIEFLYVGLDGQTKQEYDRFAASMPWPSVPFEETEARKTLEKFFHKSHDDPTLASLSASTTAARP